MPLSDDDRIRLSEHLTEIQVHMNACWEILGDAAPEGAEADGDYGGGEGGSTGGGGGGGPVGGSGG